MLRYFQRSHLRFSLFRAFAIRIFRYSDLSLFSIFALWIYAENTICSFDFRCFFPRKLHSFKCFSLNEHRFGINE